MNFKHKATKINLFNLSMPQMRAFHLTWFAFFLCFVGWFGIAPLMAVVREDLGLTKEQIGNTIIASVAITIIARLIIGWLCDRIGPRLSYTFLLILGSLPIMGIGLSQNYETFLLFRLAIGAIGASFVITQYHASIMFAPNVVGTANATTAGWGNMGGGATQFIMPLIFAAILSFGLNETLGWRLAMVVPGAALFLMGIAYYFLTQDAPDGNYAELRARGAMPTAAKVKGSFMEAVKDSRVWALAGIYAACFGLELTIDNIAALYFTDYFSLDLAAAGLVASSFGMMSIFARALGGILSDKINLKNGLKGRVRFLLATLLLEGVALTIFSRMTILPVAIGTLMLTALFVKMSEGATYAVVPFINKRALGSVAGIVAAGGNVGAVLFGFLFKSENLAWPEALFILGVIVTLATGLVFLVRFSSEDEKATQEEMENRLREQEAQALAGA
jgi:NNP family nitrate/nitrite transporter-like MFS transporter